VSLEPSNLAIVEPMAALQRFALLHPDTCRHARIFPALIFRTECLEPGCVGVKIASLSSCKTHWSTKHCTCNLVSCVCFPAEKYEPLFVKAVNKVAVHHNQAATLKSDKNASKSVRDKLKAQQAAAAIIDEEKRHKMTPTFTAAKGGPKTL